MAVQYAPKRLRAVVSVLGEDVSEIVSFCCEMIMYVRTILTRMMCASQTTFTSNGGTSSTSLCLEMDVGETEAREIATRLGNAHRYIEVPTDSVA